MSEGISREWRYNRIIEILSKFYPKRISNKQLLEELGNQLSTETLYRDVKTLTTEKYLVTFFSLGGQYFETGLTTKGMNFFEDLSRKFHSSVGTPKLDIKIQSRLDSMLSELGDEYLSKYHGSIEALTSNNPDKFSQSVSSMRELLTSILHELTKNENFKDDELTEKGRPKRKARIRRILSKSKGLGTEIEVAEAIANTLDKIYSALSKGFHLTSKKDGENILFAFKSTEYLIYYILLNN